MKVLALDCSTEACSVALGLDGEVTELFELAPRAHTQRLLPMVDSLLTTAGIKLAELDAIAFGRGPGSFTGLRICLGAVQGLAFGAQLPVLPISSLAVLAQTAIESRQVAESGLILSSFDARMDEIYWGLFRREGPILQSVAAEQLCSPERLQLPAEHLNNDGVSIVGSGWDYANRIKPIVNTLSVEVQLLPRASALVTLANAAFETDERYAASDALPVYLRDQVAWKKTAPMPER